MTDTTGAPFANAMNSCWSCAAMRPGGQIFCQSCHAVLPGFSGDYFELLDVPPSFHLDMAALEKNYVRLLNDLHPDRFAAKSGHEKLVSQSHAVDINEAYHTLSDPMRRASYILRMNGIDFDIERERTIFDKGLLMEIMERREELDTAKNYVAVAAIAAQTTTECEKTVAEIGAAIDGQNWSAAKSHIMRLQYLQKLLADARERHMQLSVGA